MDALWLRGRGVCCSEKEGIGKDAGAGELTPAHRESDGGGDPLTAMVGCFGGEDSLLSRVVFLGEVWRTLGLLHDFVHEILGAEALALAG